ncbi:MAG: phosphate ABC transporter ATP-binding protein [Anaerolineales bacterium]|nr:phosphate ABC transporter ATP-binding protein [Anaerolineales bacterium]
METHIQVKNLNVYYGRQQALKSINIEIPRNQITVIMGPSGCGKTTLLKTFNRFFELTEDTSLTGEVLVDGKNIYDKDVDVTEVRKVVGLLAQRPSPLPMSIYDNVAYGLHIHKMKNDRAEYKAAVQHYLEIAGLWEEVQSRLQDPATSLSIGQQQRLCLARGLAVEPEIILGDEPTSALDPISSQNIESRLLDLKKQYTTVIVTHTLRQAKRLADYVIYMYLGEVIEAGPAHEVFTNPQHERTKQYLEGLF